MYTGLDQPVYAYSYLEKNNNEYMLIIAQVFYFTRGIRKRGYTIVKNYVTPPKALVCVEYRLLINIPPQRSCSHMGYPH